MGHLGYDSAASLAFYDLQNHCRSIFRARLPIIKSTETLIDIFHHQICTCFGGTENNVYLALTQKENPYQTDNTTLDNGGLCNGADCEFKGYRWVDGTHFRWHEATASGLGSVIAQPPFGWNDAMRLQPKHEVYTTNTYLDDKDKR